MTPQSYTPPRRAASRVPPDPGRDRGWSSSRTWRWLLPAERERVERCGLVLNVLETPGRPAGV